MLAVGFTRQGLLRVLAKFLLARKFWPPSSRIPFCCSAALVHARRLCRLEALNRQGGESGLRCSVFSQAASHPHQETQGWATGAGQQSPDLFSSVHARSGSTRALRAACRPLQGSVV